MIRANTNIKNIPHLELIKLTHRNFKRIAQINLIKLFWEIGKELQENIRSDINKISLEEISFDLVKIYGSYFSKNNIRLMKRFAGYFPEWSSLKEVLPLMSWDHFRVLLKTTGPEKIQYYINLKIQNGLNVRELEKIIFSNHILSKKIYKNEKLKQNPKFYKRFHSIQITRKLLDKNDAVLPNLFMYPHVNSYCTLLKQGQKENSRNSKIKYEKYLSLIKIIKDYSIRQNQWFSASLILFFWELGKIVNLEINSDFATNETEKKSSNKIFSELKEINNKLFKKKNVIDIMTFSNKIRNYEKVLVIATSISWEHIVILLKLNNIEDIMYYANCAYIKKLNPRELKKEIESGNIDIKNFHQEVIKIQKIKLPPAKQVDLQLKP